jgi:hypothetical protein
LVCSSLIAVCPRREQSPGSVSSSSLDPFLFGLCAGVRFRERTRSRFLGLTDWACRGRGDRSRPPGGADIHGEVQPDVSYSAEPADGVLDRVKCMGERSRGNSESGVMSYAIALLNAIRPCSVLSTNRFARLARAKPAAPPRSAFGCGAVLGKERHRRPMTAARN